MVSLFGISKKLYDKYSFNAARSIVCGATISLDWYAEGCVVSMPHAALFVVQRPKKKNKEAIYWVSMPHAALFVVQLHRSQPLSRAGRKGVLESGRFFALFLLTAAAFLPPTGGKNRRNPLCGMGCAILERHSGRMRLCAVAAALSTLLHHVHIIPKNTDVGKQILTFFSSHLPCGRQYPTILERFVPILDGHLRGFALPVGALRVVPVEHVGKLRHRVPMAFIDLRVKTLP